MASQTSRKTDKAEGARRSSVRQAAVILLVAAIAAGGAGRWLYSRFHLGGIRNVVLISVDTCRADYLSCYGCPRSTTPNIDAVAREGVQFLMALTPVPMTTPAHSSMLTGTYPPTHGVRMNNGEHLDDSNLTLAELLRAAGYQTAAFIGGFPLDASFGLNQGFDTYDCQFTRRTDKSEFVAERPAGEVNIPALAWLEKHAGGRFFLFLHYFDPHLRYAPPPAYATAFADDLYAGEIAYVDECIGQVMERLRALRVYDHTLVIITGDHGEGLGEHGERAHALLIYQSTLHVPLVIRAPRGPAGRQVVGNVSLVDIVPTVLDMVGLKAPPQVQGMSLRCCLEGAPGRGRVAVAAPDRQQPIYCESMETASFGWSPLNGVVEGPWKYIRAPRQELYDLPRDPGELNNLFEKQMPVAQRLRGRLEAMLQEMEASAPRRSGLPVDPEAVKKLQSLGYVSGGVTPAASAFDPTLGDPKDFQPTYERLQKANTLFLSNRNEEARKELLEIAERLPRLVTPQAMLAQIAVRERRLDEAAERCAAIVSILADWKNASKPASPDSEELATGKLDTRNLPTAHVNLAIVLKDMGKPGEAIRHCEQALQIRPDYADAHFNLALALEQTGRVPEAAGHYAEAVRLNADLPVALNNLAWIRATSDNAQLRDSAEAVRLAERACLLTGRKQFPPLDTLAAAYAAAGRFPEAVATAQEAVALARAAQLEDAAAQIESHLALYRAGKPYRVGSRAPAEATAQ